MQIILIRNYIPDKQESMKRFADMLERGFRAEGIDVINYLPVEFFGKLTSNTIAGYGKWLGYIDKWILTPLSLRYRILPKYKPYSDTYFHICDHSNAPYLSHLPKSNTGITCHDVLAIRGALGYEDAYCPASSFGKILQKWILKNLMQARFLACVSELTFRQLSELTEKQNNNANWQVIHNAFNAHFSPLPDAESHHLLVAAGISPGNHYLLHVGSGLARKNRALLVDMLVALGRDWQGTVCFAGEAIDESLSAHIRQQRMEERIVSVVQPDHNTLTALYSRCEAFVFPSFSEGFGWPIIEAQACGVPVITSRIAPMPEVSGGAALHADPHDAGSFAEAFRLLQTNESLKKRLRDEGFENAKRFSLPVITQQYISLYKLKNRLQNAS